MVAKTDTDVVLQRALELCRQLSAGMNDRGAPELTALDAQLLDSVTRPLSSLTEQIGQLRADGDAALLQPLRGLKQTSELSLQLLRSIPTLSVNGPHIRLHPDSILARFATLRDLAGDLPDLEAQLRQIHGLQNPQRQQAILKLQTGLTTLNARLRTV